MLKIQGARKMQKSTFFPFFSSALNSAKYFALIGIGSNIDGEKRRFDALFRTLMNDKRIKILNSSSLLINKAFGYEKQKDFYNAVIFVQTILHARALLKILLFYEFKFRRKRSFKNAPRSLDLDILYFSKKVKKDERFCVPHVGVNDRISVILPLGELAKGKCSGTTYSYFYC